METTEKRGDHMGMLDKVVLSLYSIALTIISFLVLLVTFGWRSPIDRFIQALGLSSGRIAIGAIAGFLFVVSQVHIFRASEETRSGSAHDTVWVK